MVAGFTPVARKSLDAIAGPGILDKPESLRNTASAEILTSIWQHLVGIEIGPSWTQALSLLDTHSTLCIQRQRFPTNPHEHWDFTCMRSGCLIHDSDYYQALAESYKKYALYSYTTIADAIWLLLAGLDLSIGRVLSRFFDDRFSERCATIVSATLEEHFRQGASLWLESPLVSIPPCVTATRLLSVNNVANYDS